MEMSANYTTGLAEIWVLEIWEGTSHSSQETYTFKDS